jgi:trigger factor
MLLVALGGCGADGGTPTPSAGTSTSLAPSPTASSTFSYSDGLDDRGYWIGVTAKDHVTLPTYTGIEIPASAHAVTDEAVQAQIDSLVENFTTTQNVTDRAVVDGDTVNIDYVGSIGGVPFEGGNTNLAGTEVTIGTTQYIDNFLQQLIGHMPGDTFDVNVTFPDDYGQDDLNGKAAVFVTTINYIVETVTPTVDDAFVATNLAPTYGWTTVDEMKAGVRADLDKVAVQNYLFDYLEENATISSVPDSMLQYQINAMVAYYQGYANSYNVTLEEFLAQQVGYASVAELITANAETNETTAKDSLLVQAVAESEGITASVDDVADYFTNEIHVSDYSQFETNYGLPYLKQVALTQKVVNFLRAQAVLL